MPAVNPTSPISYKLQKRYPELDRFPVDAVQKALLAASVICALIALIPTLGTIGSLALRSVAITTSCIYCFETLKTEGAKGLLLQIMRVALVALGLAGVVVKMPILIVASLAGDIAFQLLEASKGLQKKDIVKGFGHLGIILIDTFAIIAMLTGAWPYMVTAATLSALVMGAFAALAAIKGYNEKDESYLFDAVCYTALALLGIASAVRSAEILGRHDTQYYFVIKNTSDQPMIIYDKHGNAVATVEPGKSISFHLDPADCSEGRVYTMYQGKSQMDYRYFSYNTSDYNTTLIQKPMTVNEFPTLPVGGSSIITGDPKWDAKPQEPEIAAETLAQLDAFLAPSKHPIVPCFAYDNCKTTITFVHEETKRRVTFDYAKFCETSGYFTGEKDFESNTKSKEVTLSEISKKAFNLLVKYLKKGNLLNLKRLTEKVLLELYAVADYLQIPRLSDLCIGEIAWRLKDKTWQEASLLKPFQHTGQPLSKLVDLYVF